MIRVLLVDDQQLVRQGFRTILESEPDITVVGESQDGAEAIEHARALTPDVVCMDVEMPGVDGITASRKITATEDPPAILILTTFGHEEYLFDALAAGVSGFLLKTSGADQLLEAVRTLARGDALLGPDVTRAVIERVGSHTKPAPNEHRVDPPRGAALESLGLTDRELEVLQRLAQGHSNSEIANALFLGESTVKTHVSNILRKLGARDRIQAVVWAHTHGIIDGQ